MADLLERWIALDDPFGLLLIEEEEEDDGEEIETDDDNEEEEEEGEEGFDEFEEDLKTALARKISMNPILNSFQYVVNKLCPRKSTVYVSDILAICTTEHNKA